jgi:hypothetical protein
LLGGNGTATYFVASPHLWKTRNLETPQCNFRTLGSFSESVGCGSIVGLALVTAFPGFSSLHSWILVTPVSQLLTRPALERCVRSSWHFAFMDTSFGGSFAEGLHHFVEACQNAFMDTSAISPFGCLLSLKSESMDVCINAWLDSTLLQYLAFSSSGSVPCVA